MANTKRTTAKAKGAASSSASSGRRPAGSPASTPARPAARRSAPAQGATQAVSKSKGTAASTGGARTRIPLPTEPSPVEEIVLPTLSPSELYRQEKQRRSRTAKTEADPLAEARREYLALLAAEAEKGKGGRPKGSGKKKEEPIDDD